MGKDKDAYSPPQAAYASVVSNSDKAVPPPEEYELTAALVNDPSLFLDKPAKTVDDRYADIAEAQNFVWTDDFFDGDDDVIAAFDFDYDAMESFYSNVGWVSLGCTILYTPLFLASLAGLVPCYLRRNVRWHARSQHVAITRDGIRFVRDKRPACWGLQCTDQGKSTKTVPFDMITDCNIEEPAGNSCIVVRNVLTTVNVDTASSGMEGKKELRLAGLKDAHSFKRLVWAMKRAQGSNQSNPRILQQSTLAGNGGGTASNSDENVSTLLREIRDELRQNNGLLRGLKPSGSDSGEAQLI